MVKITEELVRKKSEHNECQICTLEELSLHQENIVKIENVQSWCTDLKILLLQGNIISRIENLYKLKKLEYLNLALNNIEIIENLDKCESLIKLDLTLNFIGNLESVCHLKNNIHFRELFLTGNPCADYNGYRNYVIAKLPQITSLDCKEITRSERIKALQLLEFTKKNVLQDQEKYLIKREDQRIRLSNVDRSKIPDEEFWAQKTEHSPEVRIEMANRQILSRENREKEDNKEERVVKLFHKDGRPLNINQGKFKFTLEYEDTNEIMLTLEIYKYLDSNLIDVDVQPTYVKVKVKNKIFQIVLPEEICTSKCVAQRSQTTGFLVVKMPKIKVKNIKTTEETSVPIYKEPTALDKKNRRQYLEIGSDRLSEICNVAETKKRQEFADDNSIPPLE